ncbi:Lrp/AsnC family transcriptional regulator [Candidatus Woesearchaeota archaeon]|nr:Lrp/AsnC family transcriptional regulator [Candidatus Woesearchaeota archaeon]
MQEINDKDRAIIQYLKDNSRASIREIAKATKLRSSTVHNRIKHLISSKAIEKFTIKLNYEQTGENLVVFIMITTIQYLPRSFFKNKCIKEVFGITGEYDLMMKCRFTEIKEFNEFLLKIRMSPNITKTHTFVATTTLKEEN